MSGVRQLDGQKMLSHKETKQQVKKAGREKAVPTWRYAMNGAGGGVRMAGRP